MPRLMPYTEEPPSLPTFCPLCKGTLVLRWRGHVSHNRMGHTAVASPFFVCVQCEICVRIVTMPSEPLRLSRRAARADVADEVREREEHIKAMIAARRSAR